MPGRITAWRSKRQAERMIEETKNKEREMCTSEVANEERKKKKENEMKSNNMNNRRVLVSTMHPALPQALLISSRKLRRLMRYFGQHACGSIQCNNAKHIRERISCKLSISRRPIVISS